MKLILATRDTCGPCFSLKNKIEAEKLKVDIVSWEETPEFFEENQVRWVPQLYIFEDDVMIKSIRGSEDILTRIREEQPKKKKKVKD